MWVAATVLGILAVAVLLAGMYPYYRYAHSPEKRWRDRVMTLQRRARAVARAEWASANHLAAKQQSEERESHARALAELLHSIPVDELNGYPRIGPGTVAKLREHGVSDLGGLRESYIHIPGLGVKRMRDLAAASDDLARKMIERFDRGGCPQATQYQAAVTAIRTRYRQAAERARARAQAADAVVASLRLAADAAERVNFFRYYFVPDRSPVSAELLATALPDLDAALHEADHVGLVPAALRSRPPSVPGQPRPVAMTNVSRPAASAPTNDGALGNSASPSGPEPRSVLEIEAGAPVSAEIIRRQYQLLTDRYGVERIQHLGSDFLDLAESKRALIRQAALAMLRPLGEPLDSPSTGPQELRHNPDLDQVFGV